MIGYVTIEEAIQYITLRYETIPGDKELSMALYKSFDKIEQLRVRDSGHQKGGNNFPRLGELKVPRIIKELQILEAYNIAIGNTATADKIESGINSQSIGDMSISYSGDFIVGNVSFTCSRTARMAELFERRTF